MFKSNEVEQGIKKSLIFTLFLTTIAVTPWMTIDPINLVKLTTLSAGAFGIGGLLFLATDKAFFRKQRWVSFLSLLLVIQLFLVLLLSGSSASSQFFGTMGRNTGLLCYASLLLVLLGGTFVSGTEAFKGIVNVAIAVGSISGLYGALQFFGADPINWANKYSPVIGFLGNPNFQSSLLGMGAIASVVLALDHSAKRSVRVIAAASALISLGVAAVSNSQQGLLVFVIGISILGYFKIKRLGKTILTSIYVSGLLITALVSILGFLNKGFLSPYLYQASVTYRGDYWRAGWNMALHNPLFGVGLDSYGDNYRKYRTLEATLRRGPDVISNAAHNVFIDLAANGGIPLLVIYVAFLALAIHKIYKYLKSGSKDQYFEGVIAVWVGFVAQSVISINQIGLAVWGWILTGLIIGWKQETGDLQTFDTQKKLKKTKSIGQDSNPKNLLILLAGLILGLSISLPPLIASAGEKTAMASTQLEKILQAERAWPKDPTRSNQIASILVSNSLNKEALSIARLTTKQFPNNFDAWKVLFQIPSVPEGEKAMALKEMKKLDPLNPTLN